MKSNFNKGEFGSSIFEIGYTYPIGNELAKLKGYFIVQTDDESNSEFKTYTLTLLSDVVDYLETGVVKSSKTYKLENKRSDFWYHVVELSEESVLEI